MPLSDLWALWREQPSRSPADWLEAVTARFSAANRYSGDGTSGEQERLELLRRGFEYLERVSVPLLLVPDDLAGTFSRDGELEDPSHDPLILLFERIGTGGTRLSPGDLLFSMIKSIWPEAHTVVRDIQNLKISDVAASRGEAGLKDNRLLVGTMLSDTDLVLTAARLACTKLKGNAARDTAEPNARDFHRYLGKEGILDEGGKHGPLRELIDGHEQSPLVVAFKRLDRMLAYRESVPDDPGLPRAFYPLLGKHLVQILLYWLWDVRRDDCDEEASRAEMIRFVLFWRLGDLGKGAKASAEAFRLLKEWRQKTPDADRVVRVFPGKQLYDVLSKPTGGEGGSDGYYELMMRVEPPATYAAILGDDKPTWPALEDRIKNFYSRDYLRRFGFDGHRSCDWLVWLQRRSVARDFPQFPFLASGEEGDMRPYDFDHLCPRDHWGADWRNVSSGLEGDGLTDVRDSFRRCRHLYGNALGNYRLLASSENRSRRDTPLTDALMLAVGKSDKWTDSAFDPDCRECEDWKSASPSVRADDGSTKADAWTICHTWDTKRLVAFRRAVERRTLCLYTRLFDEAGFVEWERPESSDVSQTRAQEG